MSVARIVRVYASVPKHWAGPDGASWSFRGRAGGSRRLVVSPRGWSVVSVVAQPYNPAMQTNGRLAQSVLGGAVILLAATALGVQDERFRERQTLDPELREWVNTSPEEAEGPLSEARGLLADDEPRAARKVLNLWLAENRGHDQYYEGVYLRGEAYFALKDYWRAAEQYEVVMDNAAGELFYLAVQRTMDVARAFLAGEKRIVWRILRLPAYDEGIELLDGAYERVPGTRLGEVALKLKADYFYDVGEMENAQQEYAYLASEYPNGRYTRFAMLRSAEAAEALFPGVKFDDQPLIEADVLYRRVQEIYPGYARREAIGDRLVNIRESRAAKDLDIARWYSRSGVADAAAHYYRLVLSEWPDTLAALDAERELLDLGFSVPVLAEPTR